MLLKFLNNLSVRKLSRYESNLEIAVKIFE